jgi:hypothetical protein
MGSQAFDFSARSRMATLAIAIGLGLRPFDTMHRATCSHFRHLATWVSAPSYAKISRPEQARIGLSSAIAFYHAMDMTCCLPQAGVALTQVQ